MEVAYTSFYNFGDDNFVFFGKLNKPTAKISMEEFTCALAPVSDSIIFPPVPQDTKLKVAMGYKDDEYYTKRLNMVVYSSHNEDDFVARMLLGEALIMERISQDPHPNIVRYHGIRMRRNRITGLVLDMHKHTQMQYIKQGLTLDQIEFMKAQKSAVSSLHERGLAHNDINPENTMLSDDKMPILIDFGSRGPFELRLFTLGTEGWVENMDMHTHSRKGHDVFALNRIKE